MNLEDFSEVTFRTPSPEENSGSIGSGLRWTLAGHATLLLTPALVFIAVLQLAYVVPLIIVFEARGLTKSVKGVLLGALVGLLVNAVIFFILSFSDRPFR